MLKMTLAPPTIKNDRLKFVRSNDGLEPYPGPNSYNEIHYVWENWMALGFIRLIHPLRHYDAVIAIIVKLTVKYFYLIQSHYEPIDSTYYNSLE